MFEYGFNNIFIGQIKQLLKSTNLPQCRVLVEGKPVRIFKGKTYIYGVHLLTANKDLPFDKFVYNEEDFTFNEVYDINKSILNITNNFIIKNNYYDEYTHKTLGDYLRFQRDYNKLDLMSMYNCFTKEIANNLEISSNRATFISSDQAYNIYVVPVKFWQKYLIAIDCHSSIEVIAGFYKNGNQINSIEIGGNNSYLDTLYNNTYKKFNGLRFNSPVIYDKLFDLGSIDNETLKVWDDRESELKLFIKIPRSNTSSIVVLEMGDGAFNTNEFDKTIMSNETINDYEIKYGDSNYKKIITNLKKYRGLLVNYGDVEKLIGDNSIFISNQQLLEKNDQTQHPFADRLIEYLVGNVITPLDDITLNTQRIEDNLIEQEIINSYTPHMEWNYNLRLKIYLTAIKRELLTKKNDILGYVDKDVETTVIGEYDYGDLEEV